jgi:biopolymer transport protein TolQ
VELFNAFQHSGWTGKGVLLLLLIFSVLSWTTMLMVGLRFSRARKASNEFHPIFRRSKRLSEVQAAAAQLTQSPLVGLFKAGFAEIEAQIQMAAGVTPNKIRSLDNVERALQRAIRVEMTRLSRTLPFLATVASATPFIGLFGTVWGIMQAFSAIGLTGTTSIVAVAPGISEALINTAAGLFAAIPALIGYNYFTQRLRRARGEMEEFLLEFMNLTERNFT